MGNNIEDVFDLLEVLYILSSAMLRLYNPSRDANFMKEANIAKDFADYYGSLSKVEIFDYCLDIMETTNKNIRRAFTEAINNETV